MAEKEGTMKMTIVEALDAISRGETAEQYAKRITQIKRLVNEREKLEDALMVLTDAEDAEKAARKRKRLQKVLSQIEKLKEEPCRSKAQYGRPNTMPPTPSKSTSS